MKGLHVSVRIVAMLGLPVGFLFTAQVTAMAQRTPSSIQRRVDQLNRQGEQYERDALGREAKGDSEKNDLRRSQALTAQIRKDLETLQAGYNQIVLAMAANKTANDLQILNAVVDVKESSTRLKQNLALPRLDDDKQKATETSAVVEHSEEQLITLRKHIYNFVMNSVFESPAVLDVEQAKKASRDLDKIIEVSESISKQLDKMKSGH